MFKRPTKTYDVDENIIEAILLDEANPLNRICRLIPDGSKVLDIGAGNGLLARLLRKSHNSLIVDGIEPEPYAATIAQGYYRHFYTGYAQDFKNMIRGEDYDFIILADVIEHISDPLDFLKNLCTDLSPQTKIVLSIPNVAFGAVRVALLKGDFDYVDSGLLERTHLRFFTLKTVETLIANVNMNIEKLYFLQRNMFSSETSQTSVSVCCLSDIVRDELAWTYQFLLVLTQGRVVTEKKIFGEKTRFPLLCYLVSRLRAKF
jgi:2-polyprenyl-3-methyl-5-hydroxy-6-metoxy-1,4-benzoquinol methylase